MRLGVGRRGYTSEHQAILVSCGHAGTPTRVWHSQPPVAPRLPATRSLSPSTRPVEAASNGSYSRTSLGGRGRWGLGWG